MANLCVFHWTGIFDVLWGDDRISLHLDVLPWLLPSTTNEPGFHWRSNGCHNLCLHMDKVFLTLQVFQCYKFCANSMLNDTIFLFLQNNKNRPRRRHQEEVWLLLVPNTCPDSQFLLVLLLRVSLGKHAPRLPMDSCAFPHLRSGHLPQTCAGSCQKINGWGWQPYGTTEQIPGNPILVYETRSLFGCHCWWCCNSSIFPMHHGY